MNAPNTDSLDRVEALMRENRFEEALELFQTLYDQERPSTDRGRGLALEVVCLETLDRGNDARQLITEVMEHEGDDHAFILAAGAAFSDLGAFHHAETFLNNLCELEPDNFIAWHNLAINLGREQRYAEAINLYGKVTSLNADYPDAWYQLAYCQRLMGNLDAAAEAYRTFLQLVPEDAEAWIELGVLESDRESFDAAYHAFEQAAALDPEDAYYNWAISALRREDGDQFEICVAQLQDLNPHGWRTLMVRADYEEIKGNTEAAWEILSDAVDNSIDNDAESPDARDYVLATLLRFARRNHLAQDAAPYVDRIFDAGLFTEEVLAALQVLQHEPIENAAAYQVVLEGYISDDSDESVYHVYGVNAATPEDADALAHQFEARCSGMECTTYEIQQIAPPQPGHPGVYWRSGLLADLPQ